MKLKDLGTGDCFSFIPLAERHYYLIADIAKDKIYAFKDDKKPFTGDIFATFTNRDLEVDYATESEFREAEKKYETQ